MANNILFVLTVCAVTTVLVKEIGATRNIGFIATKGKRDISQYETENKASLELKTATTAPPGTDETKNNLIENETNGISSGNNERYLSHLPDRSIFKRTPSGFIGSRGKKDFEYSDLNGGINNWDEYEPVYIGHNGAWSDSLQNSKRTPSGFVGMRGKKKNSGFYGVRGKKDSTPSLDELYEQLENMFEDYEDFHPNEQAYNTGVEYLDSEKRANRNSFVGVRGRRFQNNAMIQHLEDYVKRVPSGFMGTRGRRFDAGLNDLDVLEQAEKRKASNSFYGVRGKKDVSKQLSQMNELEKRSPFASYFGVRGEKRLINSNGFFGTRGKKQPYEFRGKFVGVRGKKSMTDSQDADINVN